MLKVLLFIPDLRADLGAEQTMLLARGLQARGHAVRIATCSPSRSPGITALDVTHLNADTARDPKRFWRWLSELRNFAPDVVHTFQPFGNVFGRLLVVGLTRAALFATVHVPDDDVTALRRWLRTRLHARTARWIAPTASLAERWRALGFPADKLSVVPPGLEAPPKAHLTSHRSSGPIQIAVLGPFIRRKGIQQAIWALDILTHAEVSAHLHILGSGPESDRLHGFARALRTEERVTFHAFEERAQVVSGADIVWVPSLTTDEPFAVLFALACGKPVVATKVAGLVDVIADGGTGFLVPPDDKPALARQTLRLIEDGGLRERVGAAGAAFVGEHFPVARMVDEHVALYETAVRGRRSASAGHKVSSRQAIMQRALRIH